MTTIFLPPDSVSRRGSANQPSSRIQVAYGAGLTRAHVENNDLPSPDAERVNRFLHINDACETQFSGRNPLCVSRLRVDLPNGGGITTTGGPPWGRTAAAKFA